LLSSGTNPQPWHQQAPARDGIKVEHGEHHIQAIEKWPVPTADRLGLHGLSHTEVQEIEPFHAIAVGECPVDGA
jgi:hypothetical protein